jgi:hypothetical protein
MLQSTWLNTELGATDALKTSVVSAKNTPTTSVRHASSTLNSKTPGSADTVVLK